MIKQLLMTLTLFLPWIAFADIHPLEKADQLFTQGLELSLQDPAAARSAFQQSGKIYSAWIDTDRAVENPTRLHLNAGNAWLHAEELGYAIYHYRKAEQSAPLDSLVQRHLTYARSQTFDTFETDKRSLLAPLTKRLSTGVMIGAFALSHLLFWGMLAARRFGRNPKGVRALGVLSILCGLAAIAVMVTPKLKHEGVIVAREVMPHLGNNEAYASAFSMPLHAGTEFRILETRGEWIHIAVETGDMGWLRADAIKRL